MSCTTSQKVIGKASENRAGRNDTPSHYTYPVIPTT
jgi:hypothetical protein